MLTKWLLHGLRSATLFFVSAFLTGACAQTSPATAADQNWINDSKGCKAWNPRPVANESIVWDGECKDGYLNGPGALQWYEDGSLQSNSIGTFEKGRLNGKGRQTRSNGFVYEGEFASGLPHGQGVLTAPNGLRYEGNFSSGKYSGLGSITSPTGTRYTGNFVEGKYSGSGTMSMPNGDRYFGDFVDGRRTGRGEYFWSNGDRYQGQFVDGKLSGDGVFTKANGQKIEGEFSDGKLIRNRLAQSPNTQATSTDIFSNGHSVEAIRAALKMPIPESVQRQAREFDDNVVRTGQVSGQRVTLVTDWRADRANQIVRKLLTANSADASNWIVRILDTSPPIENAFVVGGRYIYVYTGLINNVTSNDELAFVLGHEISHSLLKHNLRRSEDFTNLLGSIAEIAGALARKDNIKTVGGAIKAAYSREDEQEADALGAHIANKANFDAMRGIEFFNRSIRNQAANEASYSEKVAQARQVVDQAIANCNQLQTQWNSSPRYRSQANASIINNTCQDAQAKQIAYNEWTSKNSSGALRSVLLATHPVDQERISAIVAANDYIKGRRPLASIANIGQGYNVFVAMSGN